MVDTIQNVVWNNTSSLPSGYSIRFMQALDNYMNNITLNTNGSSSWIRFEFNINRFTDYSSDIAPQNTVAEIYCYRYAKYI